MRSLAPACAIALLSTCLSNTSQAIETPPHLHGAPAFEVLSGPAVHAERSLRWYRTPVSAQVAFRALKSELGPQTFAVWDARSAVPAYIFGAGMPASPDHAKHARVLLERHIGLLAPGSRIDDFVQVSDHTSRGLTTIAFAQHADGMPVHGGQLSFRYKNGRLFMIASQAQAHVASKLAEPAKGTISHEAAIASALSTLDGSTASDVVGPLVLPLVGAQIRYPVVYRVAIDKLKPRTGYWVYVDAHSGEAIARERTLLFASGTLEMNVPARWPGDSYQTYPASFLDVVAEGAPVTTDIAGLFSWPGNASTSLDTAVVGTYAAISHDTGTDASDSFTAAPGATVVWDGVGDEILDAQLAAFVHTNRVVEYMRAVDPVNPYMDTQVPVNVNIDDQCNAFYSRQNETMNFFLSSNNCGNTARISDVVYHEYGHAIHDHALVQGSGAFNRALSEGWSDYLAATINDDSGMGRGFFKTNAPLREIDPNGFEYKWPDDIGEEHSYGQVIGGAMWDLRELLRAKHGAAGVGISDILCYEGMRRSIDIPSMFFEILAVDDDDGNLDNGTPNVCEIVEAFAAHGLQRLEGETNDPSVMMPSADGFEIELRVLGLQFPQCLQNPNEDATLVWRLRESPQVGGTLAMPLIGDSYRATIPEQADGSVVQYRIEVPNGFGEPAVFPHNPADRSTRCSSATSK